MNRPAIASPDRALATDALTKVYRLYHKPVHKFLDVFGLCPPGKYGEHVAVDNVTLSIGRGEKVALIGRNGAGKSTLLKMITGTLRPTSGEISVQGKVSALLQIGTGFHPEFTGRQNVYAGFAHMGLTGARADELFDQVVDFAELEEYIDQPMKTYSTGMAARLMFSAATVLVPDILIVDEVLGVGAAYFSHKSFEHMRQMCSNHDTTLLLVTHDLYSAMNICDRFIWIDRGRIKKDGDAKSTLDMYENSIKEQEEERLRLRNQRALVDSAAGYTGVRLRIGTRNGFALSTPLALAKIALEYSDGTRSELEVAEGADSWNLLPEGNLGPTTQVADRKCRTLASHGSIYHKTEWVVSLPRTEALSRLRRDYAYPGAEGVDLALYTIDDRRLLKRSLEPTDGWREAVWSLTEPGRGDSPEPAESEAQGQYGTGAVRIERVEFQDRAGQEVVQVRHGDPLVIEVELSTTPQLQEREVTFVIAFHKSGVATGAHIHHDRLQLPEDDRVVIRSELNPLLLGGGEWLVSIGFGQPDLYREAFNPYFAVNDRWYHLLTRAHNLQVESTTTIDRYSLFLHPAELQIEARSVGR